MFCKWQLLSWNKGSKMAFGCAALVMVMNPPACLHGLRHTNHGFFLFLDFALLSFTFFTADLKVARGCAIHLRCVRLVCEPWIFHNKERSRFTANEMMKWSQTTELVSHYEFNVWRGVIRELDFLRKKLGLWEKVPARLSPGPAARI